MTTSTLNDTTLSPVMVARPALPPSDDLGAARGVVFSAIAGLAFWVSVLGLFFV